MAETAEQAPEAEREIARVSTLELFFDLVFVLTITQITGLVVHHPTWGGVYRAAVLLAVIFYMYGGYAWLTNAVAADRVGRRLALLGGMGGFLVIALAIPSAYDDGHGIAFGLAYLFVIAVHGVMFVRGAPNVRAGIKAVLPINLTAGLLALAGSIVGDDAGVVLMSCSVVASWGGSVLWGARGGFDIGAEHFVERHGLVIIVAIGESVVDIGAGSEGLSLSPSLLITALLGLAVSAGLWWAYFGGDDVRATRALAQFPSARRGVVALVAFGYGHLVMLLGIVLLAAGIEETLAEPLEASATPPAVFLAAGVGLFLLGEALFRRTLAIGRGAGRIGAAAVALVAIPVATQLGGLASLAILAAILAVLAAVDARRAL